MHFGFLEAFAEFVGVDSDGKGAYADDLAFKFDTVWSSYEAADWC